jgi:Zn-dependent protease with chaperone function
MINQLIKKLRGINIILLLSIFTFHSFSQSLLENSYFEGNYISAQGKVPKHFTKNLTLDYNIIKDSIKRLDVDDPKHRLAFYLESEQTLKGILASGKIIYGDTISQYLNSIVDRILVASGVEKGKVKLYTLRSTRMNAVSTQQGAIFINVGLLARIDNESELAFVIAHELAHYLRNDPVNSYVFNNEIIDDRGYKRINQDLVLERIAEHSRELELIADSIGFNLAIKAGYNPKCMISALEKLIYADKPLDQVKFDTEFFNTSSFHVPQCFFLNETSLLDTSAKEINKFDGHPDIQSRVKNIEKLLTNCDLYNFNTVNDELFSHVKKLSQFEFIRLQLINQNFAEVMYNSYALLQLFPNNKHLKSYIAKALYGLAEYKCDDVFFKVANSYNSIDGQSQQIHYFIKQLTKSQLNTLALKYINELNIDNEYEQLVPLENQLIENMILDCGLDLSDFNKEFQESYELVYALSSVTKREILDYQKQSKDFYKNAFVYQLKDTSFTQNFHQIKNRISARQQEVQVVREEGKLNYSSNLETNTYYKDYQIIMIEPKFYYISEKPNSNWVKFNTKNEIFTRDLIKTSKREVSNLRFLRINTNEVQDYNDYCNTVELFQELYSNHKHYHLTLASVPKTDKNRTYCSINIIVNNNGKDLILIGLFQIDNGKFKFFNDTIETNYLSSNTQELIFDRINNNIKNL